MTTNQARAGSARKAAMMVGGLGLLLVAAVSQASAEANCPQWSTPVCTHWNLGPPASCSAWACAADRRSDPPKKIALDATRQSGRPIVTTRPVRMGTGGGTIYAKQGFSGSGVHGLR